MPQSLFLEGPAGVGKSTFAVQQLIDRVTDGTPAGEILVLLPQRTLGQPFRDVIFSPNWPGDAAVDILTFGGLAQRAIQTFWPLVAEEAGFANPTQEPTFLNLETTQYFMADFAQDAINTGSFDSVSVRPSRIMSQTLDNLSKAATNQFSLEEVAGRLITAWGDRRSTRPPIYQASLDLARRFREHCLHRNLLDFSLQVDVFVKHVLPLEHYQADFRKQYRHLIADNLEENFPVVADFIQLFWDDFETALLLYDQDAGYRVFLGADPAGMHALRDRCDQVEVWEHPIASSPALQDLSNRFESFLVPDRPYSPPVSSTALEDNPEPAFHFSAFSFYPQMIDWVVGQTAELIASGTPPREIVILAPFLGDSLRFSLMTQFQARGVPVVSHRPSRAVRDEPAARTMLTWMALAHPHWEVAPPPPLDVTNALQQSITGLDPIRASLLAKIIYRPGSLGLSPFERIHGPVQERITFLVGQRYEHLRAWLNAYREQDIILPPDEFLRRLFGEVLSQPGFGFHQDLEAGRIISELVESARRFRQTVYEEPEQDWSEVARSYYHLVQKGLLSALYTSSWRDEDKDAVFIAPAHTFLMRNRWVDHQFWLDIGSSLWWERLEQPLTHPYVLSRQWPADEVWTDTLEFDARRDTLRRLVLGLIRHCRRQVWGGIANLGEQGFEQRGPLLRFVQQLAQTSSTQENTE